METWRKIEDYDNYSVSDLGNIKNVKTGRILKLSTNNRGYYIVGLFKNGNKTSKTVHTLVAEAFIENPNDKPNVDHMNNNQLDNRKENLRYCLQKENIRNSVMRNEYTSGVKGVIFDKTRNKWCARIRIDGINVHLGRFNTIEEAKEARQIRANQAFGVFVNACEKL